MVFLKVLSLVLFFTFFTQLHLATSSDSPSFSSVSAEFSCSSCRIKTLVLPHHTCPFGFALASGSPQFQNCYSYFQSAPVSAAIMILSCISQPKICTGASTRSSSLSMCSSTYLKPPWQPPNHFHLLLPISGMHCQIICRPFQLFRFLEELSNITFSSLLTLTVVQNLVRSNQLNVSHFVRQRQHILPPHRPKTPCRPSKGAYDQLK